MTIEQLEKATKLKEEINELKRHKKVMITTDGGSEETPFNQENFRLKLDPNQKSADLRHLRPLYLPISAHDFIDMYIRNVEKQIKKLEAEFEKI